MNYFLAEALDIWRDGVSQLSLTNYLDVRLDQRLESVGEKTLIYSTYEYVKKTHLPNLDPNFQLDILVVYPMEFRKKNIEIKMLREFSEFPRRFFSECGKAEKGTPNCFGHSVDGKNPAPVEVGSLSHYLQGFIHVRWCRISSINSTYDW